MIFERFPTTLTEYFLCTNHVRRWVVELQTKSEKERAHLVKKGCLLKHQCDNYSWYMDVLEQVTIVLPLRTSQNTCTAQCKSTWRSFSDYPTMLTLHRFDA